MTHFKLRQRLARAQRVGSFAAKFRNVTSKLRQRKHDELELELDKMMTSFGAAALPQHRLRAVRLDSFSSTARLLAASRRTEFVLAGEPDKLPETDSRPSEVSAPAP
jgi:hypothetical protein